MWWMEDAGRTAFTVLAILGAVWLCAVLAIVVLPDRWNRHTTRPAPLPIRVDNRPERKAA
jgi:hypothetical protein